MTKGPTTPDRDGATGGVALLILDMINAFDFEGGDKVKRAAARIVKPILELRAQADAANWPVVYVNDNFGEWHSERSRLVADAIERGGAVVDKLQPRDRDYFVLKPQFSGFYATNLPVLLPKLGASRLVLTGVATDICVLFTAGDAHMRDYDLWVPSDAVAAETAARGRWALEVMADAMGAEIASTKELSIEGWMKSIVSRTRDSVRRS